jgi:hypothetical protein
MSKGQLAGLTPRYWYADEKGVIKKYEYCGMCLAGPFKQTEENVSFTRINKQSYCTQCMNKLSIKKDDLSIFKGSMMKEEPV